MKSITKFLNILFFIALGGNSYAQKKYSYESKFVYRVSFVKDSLDVDHVSTEYMELLCSNSSSVFRSINVSYNDSLDKIAPEINAQGEYSYARPKPLGLSYTIVNDAENIQHFEVLPLNNKVSYQESQSKINWDVQNELRVIHGSNCQKAILEYGGRKWIAWFDVGIPLFWGPYKFSGLPGLIIEIADITGGWKFELVQSELKSRKGTVSLDQDSYQRISKSEFHKKRKYLRDNEFTLSLADENSRFPSQKYLDEAKERAEINKKSDNNWIELLP